MSTWDAMRAWTGSTSVDEARVRTFWHRARGEAGVLVARMAGLLLSLLIAASPTEALQLGELEAALRRWLDEALAGPMDDAWFEAQRQLGRTWARRGLPLEALPALASVLEDELCALAVAEPRPLAMLRSILPKVGIVLGALTAGALDVGAQVYQEAIHHERRFARAEAEAQLCALSAAVAHELRNPLLGVSGAIRAIARTIPDDDGRKPVMTQIEAEVLRLDDLVKDLLDFAEPAAPTLVYTCLTELAATALAAFRHQHARVSFQMEGAGSALADPTLLGQVLKHLLQNAVEAIEGPGRVLLRVGPGEILVSDSGPGIPTEQHDRVFEPFFTTRTRGTGLGLAICRKLAEAMGGSISVVSGPLPGATLRLSLFHAEA